MNLEATVILPLDPLTAEEAIDAILDAVPGAVLTYAIKPVDRNGNPA